VTILAKLIDPVVVRYLVGLVLTWLAYTSEFLGDQSNVPGWVIPMVPLVLVGLKELRDLVMEYLKRVETSKADEFHEFKRELEKLLTERIHEITRREIQVASEVRNESQGA
jgi:hypothetical protein